MSEYSDAEGGSLRDHRECAIKLQITSCLGNFFLFLASLQLLASTTHSSGLLPIVLPENP